MQEGKTPAQEKGLVIGKHYKVTESNGYYLKGMIVKFIEDDGTNNPMFKYVSGEKVI